MTLPRSIQPRLSWYHWSRVAGYLRRVTATVPHWHLPDRKVAEIYGTVRWRESPHKVVTDVLVWEFFQTPAEDVRAPVTRRVVCRAVTRHPAVEREQWAAVVAGHPLQTGLVRDFLDGTEDLTLPAWQKSIALYNDGARQEIDESRRVDRK